MKTITIPADVEAEARRAAIALRLLGGNDIEAWTKCLAMLILADRETRSAGSPTPPRRRQTMTAPSRKVLSDWSRLPKDIYVVEAVSIENDIAFDVKCCSVPMAVGPEVRYTIAPPPPSSDPQRAHDLGWSDISTAPKDRPVVILNWWSYRMDPKNLLPERVVAQWDDESQNWRDDHGEPLDDADPSHWHDLSPLPAIPVSP